MNKTISAIIGFTLALATAGVSFGAQATPAPAVKPATTATAGSTAPVKGAKKSAKKGTKAKGTKASKAKKASVAATPAK